MADKRPLFFIKPFSESVQKLLDVCKQNAESDNIEVIVIDNVNEYSQMIAQFGPSLSVFGHPKVCAVSLQNNRKILNNLKCKAVLVSSANIPRKTLDKFMKLGLSDFIMEPIVPKTLMYKVKLLIKALPVITNEEEDIRTFSSSEDSNDNNKKIELKEEEAKKAQTESKTKNVEKTAEAAVTNPNENQSKSAKKNTAEPDAAPSKNKNKPGEKLVDMKGKIGQTDQAIDTKYRGDTKQRDENEDENLNLDEEENSVTTDLIDKYYKGQQSGQAFNIEGGPMTGSATVDEVSDDEIHKLQQSINLEIEQEPEEEVAKPEEISPLVAEKKKLKKLEVDSELEFKDKFKKDDGPTIAKKKKKQELDIESELPEIKEKNKNVNDRVIQKTKKSEKLQVDDDNNDEELFNLDIAQNKAPENDDHDIQLTVTDETPIAEEEGPEKVDDIDNYLRSKNAKKPELDIDDNLQSKTKKLKTNASEEGIDLDPAATELEVEDDTAPLLNLKKLKKEAREKKEKEMASLTIEDQETQKKQKKLESIEDSDEESTEMLQVDDDTPLVDLKKLKREAREEKEKQLKSLNIENDHTPVEKKKLERPVPIAKVKKKKELDITDDQTDNGEFGALDIDPQNEHDELSSNKDISNQAQKLKQSDVSLKVVNDEDELTRKMSKVDHIETYYGRKSKKPEDATGDQTKKKRKDEIVTKKTKEQFNKELIINHEDLGTQTIDYKKLKEDFEALGSEYGGKLKTRYEISEEVTEGSTTTTGENATVEMSHPTPDIPELAADATSEEEKTAEDAIIYPADSKGIEFAITVLDIYLSHGKEREIDQLVFEHIAKTIYKKFHGVTSFLGLDWKKGGTISFYSGHQLLPNMLLVNSDGSPLDWAQFMLQQQSRWTTAKLPTWSDTTFQAEKLEFIYPYFEGTTFIGVAVTNFESKINADVAPKIEVLLESARACYLEHLRHAGRRGEYQGKQNDTEKNKTGGLLGKFFGRKAA